LTLPSTNKSIAKSASLIGIATLFSRILGFIRDIIIAKLFGTARYAQAFVVAFRIPNMLRDLVGEGATNAAFVPVFSEYLVQRPRREFWELANVILNLLFVILAIIVILGIISSPLIVRIIAPGFIKDLDKLSITIKLTRIMFPYLILIGLTAYAMGILHTFKSFSAPAFGPCLLNLALILAASIASNKMRQPVLGLAIGVLVGGVLQLAIQLPSLYRRGFCIKSYTLRLTAHTRSGAKRIGLLLLPRAFGSAIYQLNVFIDTILASLASIVGEGGVAAIYYANRIIQFPLAVFGIAVSTAALPIMSIQVAEDNLEKLRSTLSFSLRSILLIMLPSSVGLIILSRPITRILFERGEFNTYSTSITSLALLFYSFGLFAYGGVKVLASCFHSLQDTLTPVKVASVCLIINVLLNLILIFPLKVGGLALASSISATTNFLILYSILRRKIGQLDERQIFRSFARISLSALTMGASLIFFWKSSFLNFPEGLRLLIAIIVGTLTFSFSCAIFGVKEIKGLGKWLLKRN
jgi:putative peptidoglycan lipid II flippase